MKKLLIQIFFYSAFLVLFVACDTVRQVEPDEIGFKQEDFTANWKLVAAKVTAPISIPDIYDTTNPLVSGNPLALAVLCTKNSLLKLKIDATFDETSDCYAVLGADNNPQSGAYIFVQAESSITITYNNATTIPSLVARKYIIKSLDATTMVLEYTVVQSGISIATEATYTKQL